MVAKEFKAKVLPVSNKILHFAVHFLKDEELAKDIVQDVFLKLWQKRESLANIDNIEAYAMRMARNRCLDKIRANKVIPLDVESEKVLNKKAEDVQLKYELNETAGQIKKLIYQLPEIQRTVMLLRDIEQYSYDEIANMTDLKVNAIRVNISRARKKVRDEFLKTADNENQKSKNIITSVF